MGVKQGDPLSLALFILSAEVLSRALNSLAEEDSFARYEKIMIILKKYEELSGQLINRDKSAFYLYDKVAQHIQQEVQQITGFNRDQFPLKYLGCPIFHTRRKKMYYNDLIKKVKNKLQSWKGRLLSYGGKAVLISSVLQSIPVYSLSAIVPTKYTINEMHRIFARFLRNNKEEGKKVTSDVMAKHLFAKRRRWTWFQIFGGSQIWKMMQHAREEVDQFIWWEPNNGSCDAWDNNWTKLGPISHFVYETDHSNTNIMEGADVMTEDG
ncbi:uncharacterized protein LOC132062444 [Lycium ferocissimum]|uniref:uncharacterized protein LOC132062444 n=1 Tax=Lycium ferocissimum TaxID=112874 RepID=UPI0028166441|nr:uncharacterized protein LOC132062444 [Lycium ferocissimum]